MKWRLRRQENDHGAWSVFDPALDYRICHYNHGHHEGAHIHHPSDAEAGPSIAIDSAGEAEAVMQRYRKSHGSFSLSGLNKEVDAWRSESDAN